MSNQLEAANQSRSSEEGILRADALITPAGDVLKVNPDGTCSRGGRPIAEALFILQSLRNLKNGETTDPTFFATGARDLRVSLDV